MVNAITELDCLTIILNILKQLSIISSNINLLNNELIVSGANNWKNGLDRNEILESMMRHLTALMDGEEVDSESGESHVGHILCNGMFYNFHHTPKKQTAVL